MKVVLCILGGFVGLVILIIVFFGMWAMGAYNNLVQLGNKADKAWADVQNVYQRRSDLVPNLVATVQGAAQFEKSTFTAVAEARSSVGKVSVDMKNMPATAEQMKKFQEAQTGLSSALSRLMVVTEKYPDLKATDGFRDLQAQLEGTENRIAVERRNFNGSILDYNNAVKSFPVMLFASMAGYQPRPQFEAEASAQKAPTVKFN